MRHFLALLIFLSLISTAFAAKPADPDEELRKIAAGLRCVVCQNLSVADSPSEVAQQMRAVIREQLQQGKSPEEIKAYFVSKYGEWVLLSPTAKGFNLLVWLLPFIAAASGIVLVVFAARRWARKGDRVETATIDPGLIEQVRREAATETVSQAHPEMGEPGSSLRQEQARLYAELREFEFDYQAGKLSETDYQELRRKLESRAALILREIESAPAMRPKAGRKSPDTRPEQGEKKAPPGGVSLTDWRIVAGGLFLLLFGITLGVVLTRSLRPRGSDQETITGDFLTGTGSGAAGESSGTGSKDIAALLSQGRAAFERQEFPKAIDAFKKVLALDANHPEAHTYMGLILAQAGHADGALMAFDRALSVDPKFPLALWGKGMILYRAKGDSSGARAALESLLNIMPPGTERDEVQKTLAEISDLGVKQKDGSKKSREGPGPGQIQQMRGTISVDAKLKSKVDARAVLFIIVHPAGSTAGPPLAVKRIEHPLFPLSYSLGPENVMMPGLSFSGKVLVSARLDKDGNPVTKQPGDMTGEYKKNPVEVGSQNVDIVIDHAM